MTALIDLDSYADEFDAFLALVREYLEPQSSPLLEGLARDLRIGAAKDVDTWTWQSREELRFRESTDYDSCKKKHNDAISLGVSFSLVFSTPSRPRRKSRTWRIERGSTHVSIWKAGQRSRFRLDYKNVEQWGPQLHYQIDEDLWGHPVPAADVPRLPAFGLHRPGSR